MARLATTSLPSPARVSRHTVQCLIPESHGLGMGHYVYQCVSIDTGSLSWALGLPPIHRHLFICSECSQGVDSASYTPHASSSGEGSLPACPVGGGVQWGCPLPSNTLILVQQLPAMNHLQTELKVLFEDDNTGQVRYHKHLRALLLLLTEFPPSCTHTVFLSLLPAHHTHHDSCRYM